MSYLSFLGHLWDIMMSYKIRDIYEAFWDIESFKSPETEKKRQEGHIIFWSESGCHFFQDAFLE